MTVQEDKKVGALFLDEQYMKVVQFLPYFPPHTWGVENIAQNIAKNLIKYTDTDVLIITSDIWQKERWYHKYTENWYEVIAVPAFNIIPHFPCYKFRTRWYRKAMKDLKKYNPDVIHTHTRFFLQTFHGWLWAKIYHKRWIHTEHGSWHVKWVWWIKEFIARIYDQTLWRIVFWCADKIVSINKINLNFITKFAKKSKCEVIYNWIEDYKIEKIKNELWMVRMIYIWRLSSLKWVDILLKAINELKKEWVHNFKLDIIWDWEEYENLSNYIQKNKLDNVKLLWKKSHDEIISNILPNTDILINPSHQEWLPTTVLEWLISKCVVVATDVWWTSEISDKWDLILVKAGDVEELRKWIERALRDCEKLAWESYAELKENFSWERNVKEYFRIYENII